MQSFMHINCVVTNFSSFTLRAHALVTGRWSCLSQCSSLKSSSSLPATCCNADVCSCNQFMSFSKASVSLPHRLAEYVSLRNTKTAVSAIERRINGKAQNAQGIWCVEKPPSSGMLIHWPFDVLPFMVHKSLILYLERDLERHP